jgi:hypothetical protein
VVSSAHGAPDLVPAFVKSSSAELPRSALRGVDHRLGGLVLVVGQIRPPTVLAGQLFAGALNAAIPVLDSSDRSPASVILAVY